MDQSPVVSELLLLQFAAQMKERLGSFGLSRTSSFFFNNEKTLISQSHNAAIAAQRSKKNGESAPEHVAVPAAAMAARRRAHRVAFLRHPTARECAAAVARAGAVRAQAVPGPALVPIALVSPFMPTPTASLRGMYQSCQCLL